MNDDKYNAAIRDAVCKVDWSNVDPVDCKSFEASMVAYALLWGSLNVLSSIKTSRLAMFITVMFAALLCGAFHVSAVMTLMIIIFVEGVSYVAYHMRERRMRVHVDAAIDNITTSVAELAKRYPND